MNNARPNVASLRVWVQILDSRRARLYKYSPMAYAGCRPQPKHKHLSRHPVSSQRHISPSMSWFHFLIAYWLVVSNGFQWFPMVSNPSEKKRFCHWGASSRLCLNLRDFKPLSQHKPTSDQVNPKQSWFTGIHTAYLTTLQGAWLAREHNDKSAATVTILVFRVIYKDHTHNVFSIGLATLVIV